MTESAAPLIIQEAERFRAALLTREAGAAGRLVRAYAQVQRRLEDAIAALLADVGGKPMSPEQIRRMGRFQQLRAQVEDELNKYLNFVEVELRDRVAAEVAAGLGEAEALVGATLPAAVRGRVLSAVWNRLDTGSVETLLGFLAPGSPLSQRLTALAGEMTTAIADQLVQGIALGLNPREVARLIKKTGGMGLTSALRYARTAQLWAYRESSRAAYIANGDVVGSWMWYSDLRGPNTCAACIAMHGTIWPNSQPLDDHWNGHCKQVPVVNWAALGVDLPALDYGPTGPDWFRAQPAERQLQILGPGRFQLYQEGRLNFARLVKQVTDDVWGPMKTEATLHELIGAKEAA